jgi:hypothetical protein
MIKKNESFFNIIDRSIKLLIEGATSYHSKIIYYNAYES